MTNETTKPLPDDRVALAQRIAEDIADECHCTPDDVPPCCDHCTCWKEALKDVQS